MYDGCEMPPSIDKKPRKAMVCLKICAALALLAMATGCASHRGSSSAGALASHGRYKVGAPYTIDGTTYTPQEEFNHTETGVASWYGPGFHGHYTANGEVYDQSERTAAHRTLQMPCVIRVTNLDNGASTTVRVNDRGPYARSRILDVSRATAETLGMVGRGTAHIRIDQLPEESRIVKDVALSGGGAVEQEAALARYATTGRGVAAVPAATVVQAAPPPSVPQPAPQAPQQYYWPNEPQPPASTTPMVSAPRPFGSGTPPTIASLANHPPGGYYVQTGAFSTMNNAERQRGSITSYGTTEISSGSAGGREVFRVRVGPYTTSDAAGIVADRLKRSGYGDARVVAD
jgi:rare lipoprotein A